MRSPRSRRITLFLMATAVAAVSFAQEHPVVQTGFAADKVYNFHGLDSVNTFNGNLNITLPIGFRYPVNGGFNYGLTLSYNSKVWSYTEVTNLCGPTPPPSCIPRVMRAEPSHRSNAGLGWLLSMGRMVPAENPSAHDPNGGYQTADGSVHAWYDDLHPAPLQLPILNPPATYTRDNTYFRGIGTAGGGSQVQHPDGTIHSFDAAGELTSIADPFGNRIQIRTITNSTELAGLTACRLPADSHLSSAWELTDSEDRRHYVCFTDKPRYPKNIYGNQMVKRIVLQAPGEQTSTYEFHYKIPVDAAGNVGVRRGCWSHLNNDDLYPDVPVLDRLDLPDGSSFRATYVSTSTNCAQGALESLSLPTGGKLEYTYRYYQVPAGLCGDDGHWTQFSTGVSTRRLVDGVTNPVWTYTSEYAPSPGGEHDCGTLHDGAFTLKLPNPHEAQATVVEAPDGTKEKTWYAVWPYGDPSPNGYDPRDFALPIKRHDTQDGTFLSTESYGRDGTKLRSSFVHFEYDWSRCQSWEGDTWGGLLSECYDANRRVTKERSVYHDDGGRVATTAYSDFDGFGHFRKMEKTGTFGSDPVRTSYTNYNPGTDTKGDRNGAFAFNPGDLWILNSFDFKTESQDGQSVKTEACFDDRGFIEKTRTLKNYAATNGDFTRDAHDLLAVYSRNASGNMTTEKFYGGDCLDETNTNCPQNLSLAALCDLTPPSTPAYEVRHTYSNGVRETSTYHQAGTALPFKSLYRTIDSSGAITCEKDSAELATCFGYDKMGRIKSVAPPGGAVTSYVYNNATTSVPAEVVMTRGGSQTTFQFDAIGRLRREKRLMPGGDTAIQETRYDEQGRKSYVSEWEKLDGLESTFSPTFGTTTIYDDFGRPRFVIAADGSTSEFDYIGERVKTRTAKVWTGSVDTRVSATEEYDRYGRLLKVTEKSGDTTAADPIGDNVVTKYTYDVAGRLTSVVMGPETGPAIQDRSFAYDGRGFLTLEKHPENGQTSYSGYDARGHARVRTNGGRTLNFAFDAAERLTDIAENAGGTIKPLKKFTFGETNPPGNPQKGKLVTAVRHNDLVSAGKIDVTETYDYATPSGQMSKRTTLVERVTGAQRTPIQTFQYGVSYDEFLLPRTVTMPTCQLSDCPTENGLTSVTNRRTSGYLTSVDGFASLTYHPSGMVETVTHETPQQPVDTYSTRNNIPRPSKITFSGCGATRPYFLPGFVLAKVNPNACGIQVTWPSATLCGGVSNTKYRVLRNGIDITGPNCLTDTRFVDRSAVKGQTYTYKVVAEGPTVDGGSGICQQGQTAELAGKPFEFQSCDSETMLTVANVNASIGVPARFTATLGSANGPLQDELLTFSVLGTVIGTARTASNGVAILDRAIDVDPQTYPGGIKVTYAGGLFAAKEATADLIAACNGASYTVAPLFLNVLPAGGSFPILVVTPTRCSWTPNPASGAFFTIDPASQQRGVGTFKINVPAVQGAGTRASNVKVVNKFVVVEQGSGCTFRFEPNIAYIPYKSSFPTSINISAPAGCAWSVTSNANWLSLEPSSGIGNGFITFRADRNSGKQRTAVLSLNGGEETADVNQYAPPVVECPVLVEDLTGPGTVQNGQFVSLRAHVEGTYLEYEWWIDGRPTGKCEDDRCASKNLAPGNDGYPDPGQSRTFQLVVSNSCDTVVTRQVTVTNLGSGNCRVPIITDSLLRDFAPFDQGSPFPGFEVRLWVVGLNSPNQGDLKYQWYHGFADDRGSKVAKELGGETDTINVRPGRTSFYWVEVSNDCGTNVSRTGAVYITDPPRHRRRAVSKDFTGDGKADLLWQNKVTGQNEIWAMNGTTPSGTTVPLPASNANAQMQSVGDIDDNERPDLLFRDPITGKNEVWTMSNTHVTGIQPLESRPDGRWSIGAVADLDNDYNDDIIWHNNVTGENEIWFQQGTEHDGTWTLPSNSGAGWGLHGADDFNKDDRPDLFFHDRTTGQNAIWFMNDAERGFEVVTNSEGSSGSPSRKFKATIQPMASMPDTNWMPAMIADMNLDGWPDIVWRNGVTGENKVWTMIGANVQQTVELPARTDPNWQIGGGGSTNAGNPGGGTDPRTATSMTVVADPAPLGTATAVTASLKAGDTPVAQKQVVFALHGSEVSRLLTDVTGTATASVSVPTLAAGTYPGAITVHFDGDTVYNSSSASADLVILGKAPEVTWSNPAPIVYGTPLGAAQLDATSNVAGTFVYSPSAGTILNAGYQTLAVTFTPSDPSSATITRNAVLLVTRAPSSVSWVKPEAITYGVPLSNEQLNATSTLPGTFEYEPSAGTALPVGTGHVLRVTFQPESANYESSGTSTIVDVGKGSQVLRWSDPAPILFGDVLGATQLNAAVIRSGTEPAGALTYTPPAGTILTEGVHELTVAVAGTASYLGASASVDILVRSRTINVQWATPAPILYGTLLSAVQLNATASAGGTFTYTPPAGTILEAGNHELTVVFTPADPRYEPVTVKVTLQVQTVKSEIAWSNPIPIVYGTPLSATELNAAADVPGTFVYTPAAGTILNAGSHELTVVFTPADAQDHQPASAKVVLIVAKAPQIIAWNTPATIVYGTPLSAAQLNATVQVVGPSAAGALTYTPAAGTILNAGAGQTLTVSAAAMPNYEPATATVTIDVLKATPAITWAQPAGIVYGTPLSANQLNATADVPGTFAYTPPSATILNAGQDHTLSVHFTPDDAHNYNDADAGVTIDVAKATQRILWPRPAAIVYGTALSATQLNAAVEVAGPSPAGAKTYTPAAGTVPDAGLGQTLSVAVAETANYEPASATVTIDVLRAPLSLTADPKSKLYGAPVPLLTGVLTGAVNNDPITATYTTVGTQQSPAGTYPITATVVDPDHRLVNYDVTITPSTLTVLPAPLLIAANPATKQYSDPLPTLTATYTGFVLGETPAVLGGTLLIGTAVEPRSAPGTYPITIAGLTSPNYGITYSGSTFTVTQEDARVSIISPRSISAVTSGQTTVMLTASVQDISATADAAGDVHQGDIRKATLTFVDRATGAVLCTGPIGLTDDANERTGIATCTFTRDFGTALPASLVAGAQVAGYYTRDAAADDATLTIDRATPDLITGAGSFTVTTAAGRSAPDLASSAKFELNMQYQSSGELRGRFHLTFNRTEGGAIRKFELDLATQSSLSVQRSAAGGTATIIGTATIRDVTGGLVVVQSAPVIVTATDAGEPGTSDGISVTVPDPQGGIWFATGWNGLQAVELKLNNGNLNVVVKGK